MMSIPLRLLIAAALVAAIHGGVSVVRKAGMPTEVGLPKKDLHELPLKLGEEDKWQGKDTKVDPKIFPWLGTEIAINRTYRNRARHEVLLHISAWTDYGLQTPHLPEVCYPSVGYEITGGKKLQLDVKDQPSVPARFMTLQRDGNGIQVLYWYQFGDHFLLEKEHLRRARWSLRGKKFWPPVIKVLLETSSTDPKQAEALLSEVGALAYDWTKDL